MLPTSARLLRLLSLLQARREWTGSGLAERLEITERTVRRDVDRLRSLGYPVDSTSGVAGGYRLGRGAELPPLLLEDDEALAVAIGLQSAASGTVSGSEESALRALTKLEQLLPSRIRRRVRALHSQIVPLASFGPRVAANSLSTLAGACREKQRVRFEYQAVAAATTQRSVEPHGLVHVYQRWYLVAWDLEREAWRTFRVDRMGLKITLGQSFVPRPVPEGDVGKYVSRSLSTSAYPVQAQVILHASHAELRARISPTTAQLEPLAENRCRLRAGGHSLDTLAMHLALLGIEFEVESPPELKAHVQALGNRLRRAATRSR